MARRSRRRFLRPVFALAQFGLVVVPVFVLGMRGVHVFEVRVDATLAQATPLAAAAASQALHRPVTIGRLTPGLSIRGIRETLKNPGSIPVEVNDLVIYNRPDEVRLAGVPELASIRRIALSVSLPAVLGRRVNQAVPGVTIEGAVVNLVRDKRGRLNVQDLVPPEQPGKPSAPQPLTTITLTEGRVRFRDFASKFPAARQPADNFLVVPSAFVDLSGPRVVSYQATGHADKQTPSGRVLGGNLTVSGNAARGRAGALRPDAPSAENPQYFVRIEAEDADIPYWFAYFVPPTPGLQVQSGRGDLIATIAAPQPPPGKPLPPPDQVPAGFNLQVSGSIRNGAIAAPGLPTPIGGINTRFAYVDGAATFDGSLNLVGETVTTAGSVWNLPRVGAKPGAFTPGLSVAVNAPRIQLARVVQTFVPASERGKLPPGLRLNGVASLRANFVGAIPVPAPGKKAPPPDVAVLLRGVTATGSVSGIDFAQPGLPTVRNLRANVSVANGAVRIANVGARVGARGTVSANATLGLAGVLRAAQAKPVKFVPGKPLVLPPLDGTFRLQATNVDFSEIRDIERATAEAGGRLRLRGRGNVEAVGRLDNGLLTAAANVSASGLTVGSLAFPIARARVLVNRNQIAVPSARVVSDAGTVSVSGQADPSGPLSLRWAIGGLDLETIGRVANVPGLQGLVSASGTVTGTISAPRLFVTEAHGLNLRAIAGTGSDAKRIALDSFSAAKITATKQQVTLGSPLVVRRFPASVTVTGSVRDFLPTRPGATPNPLLDVRAVVQQLDFDEIQRLANAPLVPIRRPATLSNQRTGAALLAGTENLPWNRGNAVANRRTVSVAGDTNDAPPFAGEIDRAVLVAKGRAQSPVAYGWARIDKILVGPYPLQSGYVAFDYRNKRARLTDVEIKGTVGKLSGSAEVDPDQSVSGRFNADRLDVQSLAFLTGGALDLDGLLNVSGTFSGTVQKPVVNATLTSDELTVAGTKLSGIAATGIRFVGDLKAQQNGTGKPGGIAQLDKLVVNQGQSNVTLSNARFDVGTGAVSANVSAAVPDIGALIETLRGSALANTEAGAKVTRALAQIPQPIGGSLALENVTVSGQVVNDQFANPRVNGTLTGNNLRLGTFTTDQLLARASLNGEVVTLSEFRATRPDATITAEGTYDPNGRINARLDTNQASLDALRSLPGLETLPLRGHVDVSVTATGPSSRPDIRASLFSQDLFVVTGQAQAISAVAAADVARSGQTPSADSNAPALTNVASGASSATISPERGIPISVVRVQAALETGKNGRPRLVISDALIGRSLAPRTDVALASTTTTNAPRTGARPAQTGAAQTTDADLHNDAQLIVNGSLPFSFDPGDPTLADQPIELTISVPQFNLADLTEVLRVADIPRSSTGTNTAATPLPAAAPVATPASKRRGKRGAKTEPAPSVAQFGGTVAADIKVGGSLRRPSLGGSINVVNASFTPPRPPGSNNDSISPIKDLDATLLLDGTDVYFRNTLLTLGGLNGERGTYGTLGLNGSIRVSNLENLQNFLTRGGRTENQAANDVSVAYNLGATFKDFRPAEENLAGLNEAGRSRINGSLLITGNLLTPRIATPTGQPLVLTDTVLRVPAAAAPLAAPGLAPPINPSFDVQISVPQKAAVTNPTLFRFEATGGATAQGRLFREVSPEDSGLTPEQQRAFLRANGPRALVGVPDYSVLATLRTVGGYILLPTARFTVKKDGVVNLRYGNVVNPGVSVENIAAKTRVYASQGVASNIGGFGQTNSGGALAVTTQRPATVPSQPYDVTITLNGSLDLLNEGSDLRGSNTRIAFTSDPPLPEAQIVALLLPQQLNQIGKGSTNQVFQSFATQALTASYLPQALSPITSTVASTFGLEDFTVNYNPDAPLQIRILKRLPDPFERFLVDVSRTFGTRNQPNVVQPYLFGVSYELYQFSGSQRYLPRLRLGFESNEQRTLTYFLRGSVSY